MFGVDLLPNSLRSLCKIAADIAHDRSHAENSAWPIPNSGLFDADATRLA
jgi:hypothetical protein